MKLAVLDLGTNTFHLLIAEVKKDCTWSKVLNTSGCAFSISSKSITEYGLRLIASVSCHHSSCPIYPGGDQIRRATACFSMYSDMSSLTIALTSSNKNSASAFASSVLPTPVGHAKINDHIGLFGSLTPARARRTAFDKACMA